MTIIEVIKTKIESATRSKDSVASSIFKLVLSESQRANKFDDEFVLKTVSTLVESNEVTLRMGGDNPKLIRENELLKPFLPIPIDRAGVEMNAKQIATAIAAAKNEGQALGILAKRLKELRLVAKGDDLKCVVSAIRN